MISCQVSINDDLCCSLLPTDPSPHHDTLSPHCCHYMGYSFRSAARDVLYAPSHRQDSTHHSIYKSSCGALGGMRNCLMCPTWGNDLMTDRTMSGHSTTQLHLPPMFQLMSNYWYEMACWYYFFTLHIMNWYLCILNHLIANPHIPARQHLDTFFLKIFILSM